MSFAMLPPREQLTRIMSRIYRGGMTTLSGGNLSLKDDSDVIWITPTGVDKGNMTPADIVRVLPDGTVDGLHRASSELPFHLAIYRNRPDVRAIVHAHAPALVTFSIAREIPATSIIPQARNVCGEVGYASYATPGSEELGESIAGAFGEGFDAVLLENHGVATVGNNLLDAFQRLETLDFCARTQMYAQGIGDIKLLTDEQIAMFHQRDNHLPQFDVTERSSRELQLRSEIVSFVRRACERQLMISTEGVISARVDESSFLITPTGYDRPGIDNEDVVLIRDGQRERGRMPSRSVRLHQAIYERHPHVECVITAQAPYITAYAIADVVMDTRTIPESYIMLQDVPRIPYDVHLSDQTAAAAHLSKRVPVLLLQNDCVLTTGNSVLQAFDRLEVAEFTARSLIETRAIGRLVPITPEQVKALEKAFAHLMT